MKVMLIQPARLKTLRNNKGTIPVSLLHLGAVLQKNGDKPFIYDLSIKKTPDDQTGESFIFRDIENTIISKEPELIGINCFTSIHFPTVLQIANHIKEIFPDIPIATGGAHPSLFPEDILRGTNTIDYVIVGEGEEQIIQLVDFIKSGNRDILKRIQAFAYRENGSIIHNPRISYIDNLDNLPNPAWNLINLLDYSVDLSSWNNPKGLDFKVSIPIITSRSCPFKCNFCACFSMMGRKLRLRSPSRVVDEIQMLHEEYGQNYFGFIDDIVNLHHKHFIAILDDIVHRGLNIHFDTTCGVHMGTLNEEVVDAMARAGCAFIRLPIEHGNDHMRNNIIKKHLDRDKIYELVKIIKKYDMTTSSMFIYGFPEDTAETVQDTYNMICDLELDRNYVFNIIPFPGTRVFQTAKKDHLFIGDFCVDELWKGNINLDPVADTPRFFIKPYHMEIDELRHFRTLFDAVQVFGEQEKPRATCVLAK